MFNHRISEQFSIFAGGFCLLFSLSALASAQSAKSLAKPEGLAWEVNGSWEIAGRPIAKGDAVKPGALLQPSVSAESHSIEIFLPDGQRLVYECYKPEDCARGFRIPELFAAPDPAAIEFLKDVRAVLIAHRNDESAPQTTGPPVSRLPFDESLVVLGPSGVVHVGGLAQKLPNGHYTYNLKPLDSTQPRRFHLSLEKNETTIAVPLPSEGIYLVTISDDMSRPRIELFVAAITPDQEQRVEGLYGKVGKMMAAWNENYVAWPTHDLKRAYLEWLVVGPKGLAALKASTPGGPAAPKQSPVPAPVVEPAKRSLEATKEPAFTPKPGLHQGETDVALGCDTPGATIHYTVDGSQPMVISSVYKAPIVVKSTELTIKAFASAPGKKDSAVVTGTFKIEEKKSE